MKKPLVMLNLFVLLCTISIFSWSITQANFVDNTSTPTANNTSIPLNTSSDLQVKNGPLRSQSYLQAQTYYDNANTGYYMVPSSTSRMNYIVADNTYTYGISNVSDVYIRNAGRYASQIQGFDFRIYICGGYFHPSARGCVPYCPPGWDRVSETVSGTDRGYTYRMSLCRF